ncbi:uncharacterized protein LOC123703669 [Colias croceus]|uniref:uncharacterized protein LOC123703669 n=1 Tax=Colias crocea TaxID=72248 RepID=UPI001E27DB36|nr:uncharacterized protein LOC123703669 [Colias croceus]
MGLSKLYFQSRRRYLHQQLDDDDDDDRQHSQHRRHQHQQLDDDDDEDRQLESRRRLQSLSLKLIDDRDDDRREARLRDRNEEDNESLRGPVPVHPAPVPVHPHPNDGSSNLDLLARELDQIASKYKGRGVLKVSYRPAVISHVPGSKVHNLGSLNFQYYPPHEAIPVRPDAPRPVSINSVPRAEPIPVQRPFAVSLHKLPGSVKPSQLVSKHNNGYVLLRERDLDSDRTDLRDRDDDDDDDEYDRN